VREKAVNDERPHEPLGQKMPAEFFELSRRHLPEPDWRDFQYEKMLKHVASTPSASSTGIPVESSFQRRCDGRSSRSPGTKTSGACDLPTFSSGFCTHAGQG